MPGLLLLGLRRWDCSLTNPSCLLGTAVSPVFLGGLYRSACWVSATGLPKPAKRGGFELAVTNCH